MKRAVVLVIAVGMIGVGVFMDTPHALAENISGNHYVKGKILAVESCFNSKSKSDSNCLSVIESNGSKHTAMVIGDPQLGHTVYLECETNNGFTHCNKEWGTSVGERYLQGGEIAE